MGRSLFLAAMFFFAAALGEPIFPAEIMPD
jgi:hypothetical protein